jgi:hypothetical protein
MGLATTTFQGSGRVLGGAVGQRFGASIAASLADPLHESRLAYYRSACGQRAYRRALSLHRARVPALVDELEGLAEGASVPFEALFARNLGAGYGATMADRCGGSTCALLDPQHALIGHNLDGDAGERERSYFIRVEPGDAVPFTALCRPGVLPGSAFAFNDHGVCFAASGLSPESITEGLGWRFLARALLAASGIDAAIEQLRAQPRGAGFRCTLGARGERRIVSVEVSAHAVRVHAIGAPHFQASHFLQPALAQRIGDSSRARQRRGEGLLAQRAPQTAAELMAVLRDQGDRRWPIWRDGTAPDTQVTLFCALFDLDRGSLRIYPGPTGHAANPNAPLAAAPIPSG